MVNMIQVPKAQRWTTSGAACLSLVIADMTHMVAAVVSIAIVFALTSIKTPVHGKRKMSKMMTITLLAIVNKKHTESHN